MVVIRFFGVGRVELEVMFLDVLGKIYLLPFLSNSLLLLPNNQATVRSHHADVRIIGLKLLAV